MKTFAKKALAVLLPVLVAEQPLVALAAQGQGSTIIENIVVTAQKREQTLQDVAGSISAFDANTINQRGLSDFENLAQATPGVNYRETNGSSQIAIRGVGLLVDTGAAEPNVGVHIDGIFQARASVSTLQFLDLERIEVLKGPQGTLYGRNTTGGSVNFVMAKPSEEFNGYAAGGIGSYNDREVKGYISGPLVEDKILGRLSMVYGDTDGYYDNITLGSEPMGRENSGVRGALRFLVSEDLTVDLSAFHQEEEGNFPVQHLLQGENPILSALTSFGVLSAEDIIAPVQPHVTGSETESRQESETSNVTLEVNWAPEGGMNLKSLTGFTDHEITQVEDADGTNVGIINVGREGNERHLESESWSQEFNLSGVALDDSLQWLFGLYYFEEEHKHSIPGVFPDPIIQATVGAGFAPLFGEGTRFLELNQSFVEKTESQAVFTDLTYSLSDAFRVNVGARYSEDSKDYKQTVAYELLAGVGGPVPTGSPVSIPACTDFPVDVDFSEANFKGRLEWDASSDVLLYGQWQNSFKDGGVNLNTCGNDFGKESIEAFEVGAKTTLLDGNMTLNVSLFQYDYEDLQIITFGEAAAAIIESLPESEMQGAEIELMARATEALSFDLGIALLDGEIKRYTSVDPEMPELGLQDVSGNPLPQAPEFTVMAGASYSLLTDNGIVDFRGEVFHSDDYNFRIFDNPNDEQKAYTLFNLFVSYADPSDTYEVRAFVKNASDEEYYQFLLYSGTTGRAGAYAQPRTWGVELGMRF
jgi:iron complex outermembrane recepter protein